MPIYVTLVKWTEQGAKDVRNTIKRFLEFRGDGERHGGKVHSAFWTQGQYDLVTIVEYPDDQTAMAGMLGVCDHGALRTETLRAFSESEIEAIIKRI